MCSFSLAVWRVNKFLITHLQPQLSRIFLLGLLVTSTACSILAPNKEYVPRPVQVISAPFALNGRISVSHQGERDSAGFRWVHLLESDEILLLTPFGQTAARIYRDAQLATLEQDGKRYQADSMESLMRQVLGWYLPMNDLHHWILGMPNTASPVQVEKIENEQISVLHQDGWEVRYMRYEDTLPTRLQLQYKDLKVKLLIDEWDWNPQ